MRSSGPIAVVIPAHNEAGRLPAVLERLEALKLDVPLLAPTVVDDGSTDGTAEAAARAGAAVVRLSGNRGKGAALLAGVSAALQQGAAVIVVMDADGQHRPEDIPALVAPILDGAAEVSLGARDFTAEMPRLFRFGNRLLSGAVSFLYGLRVADSQCGMRAFTPAAVERLRWASPGYAVETEMLVRLAAARIPWQEVRIPSLYLDRDKGTKPSDGLVILGKLIAWRVAGPPAPPPVEIGRPAPSA